MGLSSSVRPRRPAEMSPRREFFVAPLRNHPQHDPGKSFRSMRAMRRRRKPRIRPRPRRTGLRIPDGASAVTGAGSGEADRRGMTVPAKGLRRLAFRDDCRCGASSITGFFAADDILFFMVA